MEFTKDNRTILDFCPTGDLQINYKKMGDILEIKYIEKVNKVAHILRIDKDHYMLNSSGEIKEVNHIKSRQEDLISVSRTIGKIRDLINTNIYKSNIKNWKWITLTYKENMTDTKRLSSDSVKFFKRLRYRYSNYNLDYIAIREPQGRGAWHIHLLLNFNETAPFVPNKVIEELWSFGYTKTKRLDNIDNIGAYLSAYLGDMELTKENLKMVLESGAYPNHIKLKEVEEIDGIKLKESKKFIKGGRLYMYPPKFNMYVCSKGIKKPIIEKGIYNDIIKKEGLRTPLYTSSIYMQDLETDYSNLVIYEHYNKNKI